MRRFYGSLLILGFAACTTSGPIGQVVPKPDTTQVSPTPQPSPTPADTTPLPQPQAIPAATPEPAHPTPTPTPSATSASPTPAPAGYTTIQTNVYGGTLKQQQRLLRIAANVEKVINSDKFKHDLLNNKYNGKPGFYDTNIQPAEVYKTMMESDEFKKGKPDHIWQYELYIKYLPGELVYGEMWWPKPPIYFNSRYLDGRKDSGLAGTFCHEKSHQLGYDHTFKFTPQRPYSIPYTVGTICALTYASMFQ